MYFSFYLFLSLVHGVKIEAPLLIFSVYHTHQIYTTFTLYINKEKLM